MGAVEQGKARQSRHITSVVWRRAGESSTALAHLWHCHGCLSIPSITKWPWSLACVRKDIPSAEGSHACGLSYSLIVSTSMYMRTGGDVGFRDGFGFCLLWHLLSDKPEGLPVTTVVLARWRWMPSYPLLSNWRMLCFLSLTPSYLCIFTSELRKLSFFLIRKRRVNEAGQGCQGDFPGAWMLQERQWPQKT